MIWFTADQHFDHFNIIEYCHRPFKNSGIMERQLIHNFNQLVDENDTVYHVGDFSMHTESNKYRVKTILNKLKGKHILIMGNHDQMKPFSYVKAGFLEVHTSLSLGINFYLAHDPAWAVMNENLIWLCGHVHQLFKQVKNVINVGVDVWDYKPVSLYQIEKLVEESGLC